ncbi:hypothetical protein PoHVEF18_007766 [Penicillium ochrochloron]
MAPRLQQHAVIVLAHGNWVDRNGTGSAHHSATEDYNLGLGQVFNHADIPAGRFAVESGAILVVQYDDDDRWIERYYIVPSKFRPLDQFRPVSWTSQVYQADIMKHQIESYRPSISLPKNNLGQIFWQPWTTLTLNSIEYTDRWKVPQYVAE